MYVRRRIFQENDTILNRVKKVILENDQEQKPGFINGFYDRTANYNENTPPLYSKEARKKDMNIIKGIAPYGAVIGGTIGASIDGLNDGNEYDQVGNIAEPELTGNGLVIGAALGGIGSGAYGINRNHNFITKEKIKNVREYLKNNPPINFLKKTKEIK